MQDEFSDYLALEDMLSELDYQIDMDAADYDEYEAMQSLGAMYDADYMPEYFSDRLENDLSYSNYGWTKGLDY